MPSDIYNSIIFSELYEYIQSEIIERQKNTDADTLKNDFDINMFYPLLQYLSSP